MQRTLRKNYQISIIIITGRKHRHWHINFKTHVDNKLRLFVRNLNHICMHNRTQQK